MYNEYIRFVGENPIISAMVQFAILGTLGDILSKCIGKKKFYIPFSGGELFFKMLEWAFLAVCIKYAFVGFHGFVNELIRLHYLPEITPIMNPFWYAFFISLFMNLQFGPFLVIFHRVLDNMIVDVPNWDNIDKGMMSLIWFWIPAHTFTFMVDKPFQIGLAALWSLVLGIILGTYNKKKSR